ncbi:DNA translocase FtsK [Candidatus Chloroploca sp. Khr17]|uniref:DNA translocase FtsK n=1 Tax=Candidatus Chloroploca sp. Khr17 TaxID=2496869 RepID=UPI00101D8EC8|nr:DNA translocase FtsK [Candidatus Chloroploca sp. Khr17]
MPILGLAIAEHLSKLSGLYSIEFPAELKSEVTDLLTVCNNATENRALFVAEESTSEKGVISWSEILKWRTDDDRVFVWVRGSGEPDSSFRSVVKPFLSSRFPGDNGGDCSLGLFAELSIRFLWQKYDLPFTTESFEAFQQTARWVANVLRYSFEQQGSTPSAHWSDEFLTHWAELLKLLDQGMAALGEIPRPFHAWEIVRLAGLPIPSIIARNANTVWFPPNDLPEQRWAQYAKDWQTVIEEHVLPDGEIAVLLAALDRQVRGAGDTSPWRNLDWEHRIRLVQSTAAPVIGRLVFTSSSSPSILTKSFPTYPPPLPSWWGVTDGDLKEAIKELRAAKSLQTHPACGSLCPLYDGETDNYVLDLSSATISYTSITSKKKNYWKATASVDDLHIIYREPWGDLFIDSAKPVSGKEKDVWIKPESVKIKVSGTKIDNLIGVTNAVGQLGIQFSIIIEYQAGLEHDIASGSWKALRSLQFEAMVSDHVGGIWGPSRRISTSVGLVIPSPFSHTIIVARTDKKTKLVTCPNEDDIFKSILTAESRWAPEITPDILLKEEGQYKICVYDGRLNPENPRLASPLAPSINGVPFDLSSACSRLWRKTTHLDEDDTITASGFGVEYDVAVVKVEERSGALSSGILSVIRGLPSARKPPSTQTRQSLLGSYQDQIVRTLVNPPDGIHNSLYQYVVSSTEAPKNWVAHRGTASPDFLPDTMQAFPLPGVGNGPSPRLISCPAWTVFMEVLGEVCVKIGLQPGRSDFWLSSFNPAAIGARTIKAYLDSHRDLVQAAKQFSLVDAFWASYPFSLIIVQGTPGAGRGNLLAVLLSPLHPARLAWAFAVAFVASEGNMPRELLGFAEGWNVPFTGQAVNQAGQVLQLVAVPTDPGPEQDFATWSALAVLTNRGIAELPPSAANLPLPWGGRTGINQRVVERAIKDYLRIHQHHNSLEVDIRSVAPGPRSQEIDDAVLRFVGTGTLREVSRLSGGTRVWDSAYRIGTPPGRDKLFMMREEDERSKPFEWRVYQAQDIPTNTDVAFVENASVNLAITQGTTAGILGPLLLRRFCPTAIGNTTFDQHYAAKPDEDLLGLASLLSEIEYGGENAALRSSPRPEELGIGMGAKWEVLGTFNMDPSLLSSVIATAQATGKRLLWEWRPSWLRQGRQEEEQLARRPYYVVAKIPTPLLTILQQRQGLTPSEAAEMLSELGTRGIGLSALYAAGGSQESAAAGFFYALRLLMPSDGLALPAAWIASDENTSIYGLIPIDPIESILEGLVGRNLQYRADLLALRIEHGSDNFVRICFIPVEVKHHGNLQEPKPFPSEQDQEYNEVKHARQQLAQTTTVIKEIAREIHPSANVSPAACYARRIAFAMLLDLAMSLVPKPPVATKRANILRDILAGRVAVGAASPVLMWFAPGSMTKSGVACLRDPQGVVMEEGHRIFEVSIDPAATLGLWWASKPLGPDAQQTRQIIDELMMEALTPCSPRIDLVTTDLKPELARALGLDIPFGTDTLESNSPPKESEDSVSPSTHDLDAHSDSDIDIDIDTPPVSPSTSKLSQVDFTRPSEPSSLESVQVVPMENAGHEGKEELPAKQQDVLELAWRQAKARDLERTLRQYNVQIFPVDPNIADVGPSIVRFKLRLRPGEQLTKIQRTANDLARELAVTSVPLIENISGTNYVGVDLPRPVIETVHLLPLLQTLKRPAKGDLPVILGITPGGQIIIEDMSEFPHLLVAGATNSGKSVFLRSLVLCLITQYSPSELRLLIVDPKRTDFSFFEDLPYLMGNKIITSREESRDMLLELVRSEMPRRQQLMAGKSLRVKDFNVRYPQDALPPIVAVIDEYAQLLSIMAKKDRDAFERDLMSLAAVARSTGIHLVLATQRPSADVVTGTLKANLPASIAFKVASGLNSRIVIDQNGAENLLGRGDMLFRRPSGEVIRLQAAYIDEISIQDYLKKFKDSPDTRKP